jgi:hypothetical protein
MTSAIGLGGIGYTMHGSSGVEERREKELRRPDQTVLNEAQQTFDEQHNLLKQCQTVYSIQFYQMRWIEAGDPVPPKMPINKAEYVIAQEQAFKNELNIRRNTWDAHNMFTALAGVSLGLALLCRSAGK